MGEGEMQVHPGLLSEPALVQLPRAYEHLAEIAVEDVAVDVDVVERVVRAEILNL
jgi:hypothetical protein